MTVDPLGRVRYSATTIEREQRMLVKHIREAHANGQSYRKIAAAAGMSHEQVRRIVQPPA